MIFDQAGNLYGTEIEGGGVYQLTPSPSGWTGNLLQAFNTCTDGCGTEGGWVMDAAGNLYGATTSDGPNGGGTAYELLASKGSKLNLVYSFTGNSNLGGVGPADKLTMDAAGNLYGTTQAEDFGYGTVFKLTPSGGSWTYPTCTVSLAARTGRFPMATWPSTARATLRRNRSWRWLVAMPNIRDKRLRGGLGNHAVTEILRRHSRPASWTAGIRIGCWFFDQPRLG